MHLDEQSLRKQVYDQLMELIRHMDFSYSTRLLSEKQLAAKFQVSRSTIRAVLSELETEGKISRRHGSGTYVNPPALDIKTTLYPSITMYDLVRANGYEPSLEPILINTIPAGARAQKLNLLSFDPILEIHSVYRGDGRICMYCVDCVDARRFAQADWSTLSSYSGSLYDFIRETVGIAMAWDIINIQAAHSGQFPFLQKYFSVPDGEIKSFVKLEITNFDSRNQPFLLGTIYIDADIIRLDIVRDITKL